MDHRVRHTLVAICGTISLAALLLGATYTYLFRTFFNADIFATRVADGLSAPEVSSMVAGVLSDQIIAAQEDLLPYRPVIVSSVERVVSSTPFRVLVKSAVKEMHEAILSETGKSLTLTVSDAGVIIRDALSIHPEIAEKIPTSALAIIADEDDWPSGEYLLQAMRLANRARTRALVLLGLSLALGIVAVALARRKDQYLLRYGLAMAICGVVVGALVSFGGPIFASFAKNEFRSALAHGLWTAFIGPLALRLWIFAGIGLVLVAGVTSTFSRVDIAAIAAHAWRRLEDRPGHYSLGLLRGLVLAVVGGVAAFNPTLTLQVLAVAGASLLFFFGIQEIFLAIMGWIPRVEAAVAAATGGRRSHLPRIAVAAGLGVVVIGASVLLYLRLDRAALADTVIDACNGHPELCDRRLDRVAIATTHNSMSAGDIADWMFPNQQKGIRTQLEDGVRGFLVDLHYAVPVGDRIKTVIEETADSRAKYEALLGKEAVDAAMRIRDRMVGEETGERDVYFCHGFCELGATRFVEALEQIDEFLLMNPGEVIVIVIQDEGVSPLDVAACFEKSGLDRLVYRGAVTAPWPTLREMVERNQRVVVFGENDTAGVPWYHPAFEVCQETPFGFKDPSEFSNKPNRGGTKGSLLLLNHWIETTPTPLPSNAEIVNAYDFLLQRARAFRKERGRNPNLIAVDFYRSGDLLRVVDTLNGFKTPVVARGD